MASTFCGLADSGTTTVAGLPCARAAHDTARPWLPAEAVITPRAPGRASSFTSAPRSLNARMGVVDSSLIHTSRPSRADSRGAASSGVGGNARRTMGSARATSLGVTASTKRGGPAAAAGTGP